MLDINTENVQRLYNMNEQYPDIADSILNWNSEVSFDKSNNMYFPCANEDKYIIRKLNLDNGEIKDIFTLDIEGTTVEAKQEKKELKMKSFRSLKKLGMRITYIFMDMMENICMYTEELIFLN